MTAFDSIEIAATQESVIKYLGEPSVLERQGILFSRYASHGCNDPCVVRLWFENRLSLDTEAWSVELDKEDRVIKKYHWMSP